WRSPRGFHAPRSSDGPTCSEPEAVTGARRRSRSPEPIAGRRSPRPNPSSSGGPAVSLLRHLAASADSNTRNARAARTAGAPVVDARRMAIRPGDADAIVADRAESRRAHALRNRGGIEERPPGHLFDAHGALAAKPEVARRVDALVPVRPEEGDGRAQKGDDL